MSVQFNLNTPVFAMRPAIHELVLPFLNRFGLNYFQFLRCYSDGSFGLLTNDTRLLEHFLQTRHNEPVIFSSYESRQEQLHSWWFLWDEKLGSVGFLVDLELNASKGYHISMIHNRRV